MEFLGRKAIYSASINGDNLKDVLRNAVAIHTSNVQHIEYLYAYYRGKQPIGRKEKIVRPEINNKVMSADDFEKFNALLCILLSI